MFIIIINIIKNLVLFITFNCKALSDDAFCSHIKVWIWMHKAY